MQLTTDELATVRQYIFLGFLLDYVEMQKRKTQYHDSILRDLYVRAAESLMAVIYKDLIAEKTKLKLWGVKVVQQDPREATLHFEVICRGYTDQLGLMKEHVKAQLGVLLGEYITKMNDKMVAGLQVT